MNRKFSLALLSSPILFASMVSMVVLTQPAQAKPVTNSKAQLVCMRSPHSAEARLVCERRQNPNPSSVSKPNPVQIEPNQITEVEFTEEESDRAIALFGCDCPSCINSLRQLRGLPQVPV